MQADDSIVLCQRFPQFSFAKQADEWLASLEGKSLLTQLQERRVSMVRICPLLSAGGLGLGEDGNFFVVLNDLSTSEEGASSLGHEVAHTFHYDLTRTPPLCIISKTSFGHRSVEEFCSLFSDRWLAKNGRERVALCCKNQASLITCGAISVSPT